MWGSEFTLKVAALQGGMILVLMPLFAAALVVRRRYFIVALRTFPAAPLVVRRRCLIAVPMPMPEAPRMYLIVVFRPFPAAPLVVRCMYMAVVPGPMPDLDGRGRPHQRAHHGGHLGVGAGVRQDHRGQGLNRPGRELPDRPPRAEDAWRGGV